VYRVRRFCPFFARFNSITQAGLWFNRLGFAAVLVHSSLKNWLDDVSDRTERSFLTVL
jgi:hypothetical protein